MSKDSMNRRTFLTGVAVAGASSLLLRADAAPKSKPKPTVKPAPKPTPKPKQAAEPTLEETTDWLLGKIGTESGYTYSYSAYQCIRYIFFANPKRERGR